jgi:hypothetical protein
MKLQETYPELLRTLRAAGLDPDRLEPWAAWKAFKACLRRPSLPAEHAAYVEFGVNRQRDDFWHLTFVLQLAAWEAKLTGPTAHLDDQGTTPELNVVREIVIDLAYESSDMLAAKPRELASGEFSTLDDFIAAVESEPCFQSAMSAECVGSLVYEDEA